MPGNYEYKDKECDGAGINCGEMMEFLETQPYLVMSLLLLLLCAAGLVVFRKQRRSIVLASLLSMPFCIYETVFIPEYWSPAQLGGRLIGLADVLFSFSTGGIAWICATFCIQEDLLFSWNHRLFLRRFFGGAILGVMVSLMLWFMGFKNNKEYGATCAS